MNGWLTRRVDEERDRLRRTMDKAKTLNVFGPMDDDHAAAVSDLIEIERLEARKLGVAEGRAEGRLGFWAGVVMGFLALPIGIIALLSG